MNSAEANFTEHKSNSYSEIYCRFSPFRYATPLSRTNSRQCPPSNRNTQEIESGNKSNDGQRKTNSAGVVLSPRNRSVSRFRLQSNESRGSPASRQTSAAKCQRIHSAVYKTDESNDSKGSENQLAIEDEIVKGNQISIQPVENSRFDDVLTPIKNIQEHDDYVEKSCWDIQPENSFSADSPRNIDRANLLSRGSSLMLGSGRIRKSNDTETLELHIDESEFSSVQEQITSHVVSVTIGTSKANTPSSALKESKLSPRPFEVVLPKTFITKSGSLLLYSDSELMKGADNDNDQSGQQEKKRIEIKGRKVYPRTLVPQVYPYWGKLVNRGKHSRATSNSTGSSTFGCTKKEQRDYIGINKQENKPHTWDYTVLPAKLINESDTKGIKTLSNLSEAVLAYQSTRPTSKDKYLSMMKQSYGSGKTKAENMNEQQARQLQRLSTWTREWVGLHGNLFLKKADQIVKGNEADKALISKLRKTLKKKVQTPANTPSRITKQTYVHNLNKMEFGKLLTNIPRSVNGTEDFSSAKYK